MRHILHFYGDQAAVLPLQQLSRWFYRVGVRRAQLTVRLTRQLRTRAVLIVLAWRETMVLPMREHRRRHEREAAEAAAQAAAA